jgi:hypothetical protein
VNYILNIFEGNIQKTEDERMELARNKKRNIVGRQKTIGFLSINLQRMEMMVKYDTFLKIYNFKINVC